MFFARLRNRAVAVLVAFLVAALGAVGWRRQQTAQHVAELRQAATTDRDRVVTNDDLEGLPTPVRAYFTTVLEEGQPYVDTVRLEQRGKLRPGDGSSAWKPFAATQYVTAEPPGFVWDATVSLVPFVSVRVRDRFAAWSGAASVSLGGVVPLERADSRPELDEAALMRYLAEAVWYPTALLPAEGVEWDAIDDRTAKATIEHGDVAASLTVSFTDDNEIARVHADRYRRVDGGYELTPWSGYWRAYETRNGVRVPTVGDVVWHRPDGNMHAWHGRVTEIQYNEW